jgi:YrbI family 3-deoxy-D-manno-octulosonate 8-phosphate phosphatase
VRLIEERHDLSHGKDIKQLKDILSRIRLVAFDFDGVFTDNMVYVFENGTEAVRCTRGDGIGLQKLRQIGIETVIISTEVNPVVSARARKLKIDCVQNCQDKRAVLEERTAKIGISLDQVAFVGNDINDLACLTCVGLPIVVQDAHPDVVAVARYQTRQPGGHGAVREVCDLIVKRMNSDGLE